MIKFHFQIISRKTALPLIKELHYAKRIPSISYAFGVFSEEELMGVVTFGKPASNALCEGICGVRYKQQVFELNRLILIKKVPNLASQLVGYALKQLKPLNLIIVSYADLGQHHNGYIYQATNLLYTGKTKERTDKYVPQGKHSRHYMNGETDHLRVFRTAKLRYVYFACNKKQKKEFLKELRYPILSYPKYENKDYILGEGQKRKVLNKKTMETWYE